jgi:hypothetical protein
VAVSKTEVSFTDEEREAVQRTLELHAKLANADAPDGMEAVVPQKLKDGIVARGLTEYAADLTKEAKQSATHKDKLRLVSAAINATVKAYNIHHLPVYLFYLAGMFEFIGQTTKATHYFRSFLEAQGNFQADKIDDVFLRQIGFDIQAAVTIATERIG